MRACVCHRSRTLGHNSVTCLFVSVPANILPSRKQFCIKSAKCCLNFIFISNRSFLYRNLFIIQIGPVFKSIWIPVMIFSWVAWSISISSFMYCDPNMCLQFALFIASLFIRSCKPRQQFSSSYRPASSSYCLVFCYIPNKAISKQLDFFFLIYVDNFLFCTNFPNTLSFLTMSIRRIFCVYSKDTFWSFQDNFLYIRWFVFPFHIVSCSWHITLVILLLVKHSVSQQSTFRLWSNSDVLN